MHACAPPHLLAQVCPWAFKEGDSEPRQQQKGQQPQQEAITAGPAGAAAPSAGPCASVTFKACRRVAYGQVLKVVGDLAQLGAWDCEQAPGELLSFEAGDCRAWGPCAAAAACVRRPTHPVWRAYWQICQPACPPPLACPRPWLPRFGLQCRVPQKCACPLPPAVAACAEHPAPPWYLRGRVPCPSVLPSARPPAHPALQP